METLLGRNPTKTLQLPTFSSFDHTRSVDGSDNTVHKLGTKKERAAVDMLIKKSASGALTSLVRDVGRDDKSCSFV